MPDADYNGGVWCQGSCHSLRDVIIITRITTRCRKFDVPAHPSAEHITCNLGAILSVERNQAYDDDDEDDGDDDGDSDSNNVHFG